MTPFSVLTVEEVTLLEYIPPKYAKQDHWEIPHHFIRARDDNRDKENEKGNVAYNLAVKFSN